MSRILSLLLVLAMTLTMMPVMAFAETGATGSGDADDAIELVAFGNSTTNGYGMPDCDSSNMGFSLYNNYLEDWAVNAEDPEKLEEIGFDKNWKAWTVETADSYNKDHEAAPLARMSEYAFPWMVKEYLSGDDHSQKVNLTPVNLDGIRSDCLRGLLDKDYYNRSIQREADYTDKWYAEHPDDERIENYNYGFFTAHMGYYVNNFYSAGAITEPTYEKAAEFVQQKVSDADVIIIDVCGNNFGTYLMLRTIAMMGVYPDYVPNTYETVADVDTELLTPEMREQIRSFRQYLLSKVSALQSPMAQQIIDSYLYGLADCIVNFNAYNKIIRELNPDAAVINVGINNPLEGLKFKVNGTTINVGKLSGVALDIANAYMKSFDENADKYYFADLSDGLESFESAISGAADVDELLADTEFGCGNYAINLMYSEFVKEFLTADTDVQGNKVEDGDARTVYSLIQAALPGRTFSAWDDLSDNEPVAASAGADKQYVVYDTGVAYDPKDKSKMLADAISTSPAPELTPDETAAGKVILTKNVIVKDIVEGKVRPMIMDMLHEALKYHQTIDAGLMQDVFGDMAGQGYKLANDTVRMMAGDQNVKLDESEWTMLVFEEKFFLAMYFAIHPDKRGCEAKSKAIIEAYERGVSAREQTRAEIRAELEVLTELFKYVGSFDYPGKINAKLSETKAIIEELEYLDKQLTEAETKEDYEAIFNALQPVGEYLVEIAPAVAALPEYKDAVNAFKRLESIARSNIEGSEVTSAKDSALLTAESIDTDFSAKVTFPGSKAKITLTIHKDEFADGYVLKLNGKQVRYSKANGKLTYTVSNAKVGSKYKFELTPYVLYYENGKVRKATGKTVSKTVTPKVSLKKAAISSVKAGSKTLTVKWAKVTGASGYKISYKLGSKTKYVTVKGGSKKSKTVRNLTSGNYTVKVRAYKTVNGKKHYGKWSNAKKVKVK